MNGGGEFSTHTALTTAVVYLFYSNPRFLVTLLILTAMQMED